MMRKIYDYFFIIQTRIYQLEIFCSIENKSKYFASMQILQHQTSFIFLLEVKKQKKKKKYVDYFNNYCIMQTINFWSLLPANHLLLLFVYIVIVWRERERQKKRNRSVHIQPGIRWEERESGGGGPIDSICNFVVVSRVRKSARKSVCKHIHTLCGSKKMKPFPFPSLFLLSLTCDEQRW